MDILHLDGQPAAPVLERSLPYVLSAPVRDDAPKTHDRHHSQTGPTILFVDDEPSIREMATLYLTGSGYRVVGASDGTDALRLWKQHADAIDLVVTDLIMPGGPGGRELVERLRADRPSLNAIFVSGHSFELCGDETFLDEASTFLRKPYRLKDMSDTIRDRLKHESGICARADQRVASAGG